jgi:single-strand DNA-binding protein
MAIAASFAGNLGQDSESKFVGQGTPLLSFSVAVSYFDKEKKTQWVRCSLFGKRAESLAPMLLKGTTVFVRGALVLREYEAKGERKTSLECNVDDVEFVGGKSDGANRGTARPQGAPPRAATSPTAAAYGQAPPRGFGADATGQGQQAAYGGGAGYGGGNAAPFAEPAGDDSDIPFLACAFDPHRWP